MIRVRVEPRLCDQARHKNGDFPFDHSGNQKMFSKRHAKINTFEIRVVRKSCYNQLMSRDLGAVEYDVRVDGVSTVTVRLSDVTLRSLESGVFYNVEIFSIGVRNRLSERSSDIIRIQTSKS